MNEQVGSKIIQLLSLGKPDTSYKEDGQLRKNLSPIQKSVGKPDSYSAEEGEILEKETDKFTVGKYVVTVNPGDEEDFTCQENLIESYLVEEMLGFEEDETPRSTGESDETKKSKENNLTKSSGKNTEVQNRHEGTGKPVRSPKDTTLGKSGLSILQLSGKSDVRTHQTYTKKNKNSKESALGKPELFPVLISGKSETSINRPKKQNTKKSKDINSGKSELCPVEISGKSDKLSHFPNQKKYKKTNEIGIGKLQMSGKSDLSTDHYTSPPKKKHGNETALGQSELFPVQMSGKSDKSTHSRTAKDYKNTVKKSLGRSKLSPVQKSGKSDKSTHESPQLLLRLQKNTFLVNQSYLH